MWQGQQRQQLGGYQQGYQQPRQGGQQQGLQQQGLQPQGFQQQRPGQQQQQQQPQQYAQLRTATSALPAMQATSMNDVKSVTLGVTGCTHVTVGPIVRGQFSYGSENHGKPVFKKDQQVNGLDVCIYFWDERDGPSFCGWWFGPKVGGDQVWAYHPDRNARVPPPSGWKVPYDGAVDVTFHVIQQEGIKRAAAGAAVGQTAAKQANWGAAAAAAQGYTAANPQQGTAFHQQQATIIRKQQEQQAHQKQVQEANLKKMQEMKIKQQEEAKKKAELDAKKREENRAAGLIRRVIQKMRMASEVSLDALKKELEEILAKEKKNCGSLEAVVQTEADKSIEQGLANIEKFKEQKKKAEEARAQTELKNKEAVEKAAALVEELSTLVETAEAKAGVLHQAAEPFLSKADLELTEVESILKLVAETHAEAKASLKVCSEFLVTNSAWLTPKGSVAQLAAESMAQKAKVLTRLTECTRSIDKSHLATVGQKDKAEKRAAAKKDQGEEKALFKKFDADKDGMLSRGEVQKLAKSEYSCDLSSERLDVMWKVLVEGKDKGVKFALFQEVKTSIGIARELVKDASRVAVRKEKERLLAEAKAKLEDKFAAWLKRLESSVEAVTKLEEHLQPLMKQSSSLSSDEMLMAVDEGDALHETAKTSLADSKKEFEVIDEDVEDGLKLFVKAESSKLNARAAGLETRISRAVSSIDRIRVQANSRRNAELAKVRVAAIDALKYHQRTKEMTTEQLFTSIDANKDGRVESKEFLKFFTSCEKPQPEDQEKTDMLTPATLLRLFASLIAEEKPDMFITNPKLSKDYFLFLVRVYMKVVEPTVITEGKDIKDSKTIRRLEVGETVEVLEGPIKDGTVDIERVHVKVLKDDLTGWVTISGNKGTAYLEEGGHLFKCMKETIFTPEFELESSAEDSRKLKDTTRKLKVGEVLEVYEWPRAQEKTGLTRMRARCRSDRKIGWATTVGNSGIVFLVQI